MKILIIEDEPSERLLRERQIRSLGFEYTSCAKATTALKEHRQIFYPLIITDLGLPEMDGFELCRCIRSLPQGKLTKILVISGRDTPEDIRAAMNAGADDFLRKPVSSEHLNERVRGLMQLHV